MMMMIMMMMIMMMMMMMSPLDYATGQFSSLAGVCLKTSKRVLILPFPQKVEGWRLYAFAHARSWNNFVLILKEK